MVVVEAAARGTPSVVVAGEDNAATELIEEGVNGFVAASADAGSRSPTRSCACTRPDWRCARARRAWFAENARRLSLERSLQTVLESYAPEWRSAPRVALERQAGGALPGELAPRARGPRRAQPLDLRPAREQPLDRRRDRRGVVAGRTAAPRRPRPRAARTRSSRRPARRAPSPRAPAARSPRTARGTRTRPPAPTGPRARRRETQPGKRTSPLDAARPRPLAQLVLVPRRIAGQHQQRPALGLDQRERVDQRGEVLVRALGRQAEQHPALAELEALARLASASGCSRADRAEPERNHVDALGRDARAARRGRARALRVGDHAVRTPRRGGHEHPHALVADARVGLGEARVDEVVDRDHAAEAAPQRRRAGEAVHELDAGARRPAAAAAAARPAPIARGCGRSRARVTAGSSVAPRPLARPRRPRG